MTPWLLTHFFLLMPGVTQSKEKFASRGSWRRSIRVDDKEGRDEAVRSGYLCHLLGVHGTASH